MGTVMTRRIEKLEQQSGDYDRPCEIVVLKVGEPEPILADGKEWIVVRLVSANQPESEA